MSRNFLSKNDELRKGDFLISNNGQWKAVFEDDGNFRIYGWTSKWTTDTNGLNAFRLCMQSDCNLVMYTKDGKPVWHTNTSKDAPNMNRLFLTDDGVLHVDRESEELWNSNQGCGMK